MGSTLGSTIGSSFSGSCCWQCGSSDLAAGNSGREGTTCLSNTLHCCGNIQQYKSFVWLERHRCKLMGISNLCEQNTSSSPSLDISDELQPSKAKGIYKHELHPGTGEVALLSSVFQWSDLGNLSMYSL